jgi:HlyD family secretion protein
MDKSIFRKVSLERLSSPEQLDQVLRVTSPRIWVGVAAIFGILVTTVIWGFLGSISTTAAGQGVIIRRGGVLNVVSRGGGLVLDLKVKVGDRIKANQVIATIAQPVLAEKIKSMHQAYAEALSERERSLHVHTSSARLQIEAVERQRANTELQIQELTEQARLASEQTSADEQLLAKGLITRQQAIATKQKRIGVDDQIAAQKAQLKQLDAQKFAIENQPQDDDANMRNHISSLQRDLAAAEKELSMAESVVTPYGGEVLELKVYPGGTVNLGEAIISIQPDAPDLELVAYMPSAQAKDTELGMEVEVSPTTIKREEYGYMRGTVDYVADFPATEAALMRNFENESLARVLTSQGAVTEIRVSLKRAADTPSGFQWSTSKGPRITLSSGTMCNIQIVTKRQKPITLLFPYVKEKFGLS